MKDKACDHKWTQPIHVTGQPPATIEWDEKRRRWSHSIFDKVLFCLPGEESPVESAVMVQHVDRSPAVEQRHETKQDTLQSENESEPAI